MLEQRKNLEFVVSAKGEELAQKEMALRMAVRKLKEDGGGSRRVLELLEKNEELQATITRKNIIIERLLFHKEEGGEIESEDESSAKDLSKNKNKADIYLSQLDLANKLILKKNL